MAAIGLLGLILSPLAELLIARLLPRVGPLPGVRTRMTTAAVTAAVCIAFALRFGNDAQLPAFMLLAILGIQLARIDISLHLLPNQLVLALLFGGLILLSASTIAGEPWSDVVRAVAGGAILFVIYLILGLISPQGIGMGDVKLAGPVGLYLGYLGWSHLLYGGLLGFILGGIASALMLRLKRANRPTEVAFGPSMLATTVALSLVSG
ncbi:A24 family peptidase [Pseudarthrobacter sp. MDT3-26]|uniref:prepilin peptidase n=1 Tax=Pseudarthrobacter raffinosi TaxID=2953651 RepID=UPI00208E9ECD|nr:A24 family peptidase [Pseudarthrobacter sp. MDT3-26]MCO4263375.1 A24 family peptidase [Pseudarthrobacter sp. MDT3-26]